MKKFPSTDSDSSASSEMMDVPAAPKATFINETGLSGRLGDEPIKTIRTVKVGSFATDTRISEKFANGPAKGDFDGLKETSPGKDDNRSDIVTNFSK